MLFRSSHGPAANGSSHSDCVSDRNRQQMKSLFTFGLLLFAGASLLDAGDRNRVVRVVSVSQADMNRSAPDMLDETMERLERAETIAAIRRGMAQADRGEGMPLAEAEARLRKKHGFSR